MIVADVISRVKRQFGDESGAQVTDADIIRWINDGQNEIAQMHELLEATAVTKTLAGKVDYELPDSMVTLQAIYYNGAKLRNLSNQEFDEYIRVANDGGNSEGSYVYTSWGNRITLFPAPASSLDLRINFSCFPAPVEISADELNIPLRYHNRLVEYVLAQAYELDENFEAATFKANQMTNAMSQTLGDEQWDEHSEYPTILVRAEDAW